MPGRLSALVLSGAKVCVERDPLISSSSPRPGLSLLLEPRGTAGGGAWRTLMQPEDECGDHAPSHSDGRALEETGHPSGAWHRAAEPPKPPPHALSLGGSSGRDQQRPCLSGTGSRERARSHQALSATDGISLMGLPALAAILLYSRRPGRRGGPGGPSC